MKHILKVASLENLPNIRPLIAMNDDGDLKWLAEVAPSIEMVDLGLTSGTLWAKTNIGAQSETEAGLYFAWGEVAQHEGWPEDKTSHPYNWHEYKYAVSNYRELTKYCTLQKPEYWGGDGEPDDLRKLQAEDDIATVSLGSGYRMPSSSEFQELIDETDNEQITINGINGWKFTNKSDSSKYIFLPAAGYCYDPNLDGVGDVGYYWSSSLDEGRPSRAWGLYFDDEVRMYYINRCDGLTVRPVSQ